MSEIRYVDAFSLKKAADIQQKFVDLPSMAKIIFVGVTPVPAPGGKVTSYEVRLGISKDLEESVGHEIIKQTLETEIQRESLHILASVYRGVSGSFISKKITQTT